MKSLKIYKSKIKQRIFSHSNKIEWWKILLIVITVLIATSLIALSFFNDGYEWFTNSELIEDSELYRKQVLFGAAIILAGFSLPIVGCTMQITTRNKLAEPTTLGFYPVIFMGILLSQIIVSGNIYVKNYLLSFALSFIVIAINFIIVKGRASRKSFKSILIGFSINAIATGINYLIIEYGDVVGNDALDWLRGNFGGVNETSLYISLGLIIGFLIVLFILIPQFNIIQKDYLLAKSLGIKVDLIYWIVALCAIVITISSILLVGGVVLIGVVVPHIVRLLFRTDDNKIVMPLSGVIGVLLLSMSNWMVKGVSYYGVSLNINLLIAAIAIPIFIFVLKGRNRND